MLLMPEPPYSSCQVVNMPHKNVLSSTLSTGQSSVHVFTCVQCSGACVQICFCWWDSLSVCVGVYEVGLRWVSWACMCMCDK